MNYLYKILKLVKCGRIKTSYSHNSFICRQDKCFRFDTDCSGLLEFWLSQKHRDALKEIYDFVYGVRLVDKTEIKRLYSFDVYDFFAQTLQSESQYWQAVKITEPWQKGDVVAFVKEGEKNRFGHIAIVDAEITRTPKKITVKVIDSSAVEHIKDWRQSKDMGIGEGIIEVHLTDSIPLVGYRPDCLKSRRLLIGRLKEQGKQLDNLEYFAKTNA